MKLLKIDSYSLAPLLAVLPHSETDGGVEQFKSSLFARYQDLLTQQKSHIDDDIAESRERLVEKQMLKVVLAYLGMQV